MKLSFTFAALCASIWLRPLSAEATMYCLYSDNSGDDFYCTDPGRVPQPLTTMSWTLTANGDIFVVRDTQNGNCSCTCNSSEMNDFDYSGGTLTVKGMNGVDRIYLGDGSNIAYANDATFAADGDYDFIRGGPSFDKLYGHGDIDYLFDNGGAHDELYGFGDADCLADVGGFDVYDCGGGVDHYGNTGGTNCNLWTPGPPLGWGGLCLNFFDCPDPQGGQFPIWN